MVALANKKTTNKKTKKLISKLMGKSKKSKSKKVISSEKTVDKYSHLKIPTQRPNNLKIGTIKKGRDNKLWKVVLVRVGSMNYKKWTRATTMDIKCTNYLQNSIKKNIIKYKSNNKSYKSANQAIAIAYAMTKKRFPKCSLINNK